MDPSKRTELLQDLARGIEQRRLTAPARIMLDVIAPLGFLAGQMALFARPLLPTARWRAYAQALGHEESWSALQELVGRH